MTNILLWGNDTKSPPANEAEGQRRRSQLNKPSLKHRWGARGNGTCPCVGIVRKGREFAAHEELARGWQAAFYFCQPYSSWERGLNENTNGLIRQYFPEQTPFATITDGDIKQAQDQLNNRPRKTLGYDTPNEVYGKEQEQLRKVALTT